MTAEIKTSPQIKPKKTAGERWVPIDSKTATHAPLKTVEEIAAEKAAVERAIAAETFPDFTGSLELLRNLNDEEVATQEEWKARQPRLRALKAHIHKIQQGLPTIPTTADQQMAPILHRGNGPQHRAARIKALEAFLKRDELAISTLERCDLPDPKARLLKEPAILEKIWRCRRLLAAAEIFALQNFDLENPMSRIAELEHALSSVATMDQLREIALELTLLKADSKQTSVPRIAHGIIEAGFQPALKEIALLLSTCREFFYTWRAESQKRSDEFFSKHGLSTERTALVRRFDEAAASLPPVSKDSLSYFGVGDIAAG
jgi:hypothetical protein